jgi:DNA-directed RNA polymerase omega subunit
LADEFENDTFLMVNVAAQRARQIMQGATPLIRTTTRKPAAIAVREVRAGLIQHFLPEDSPFLTEEAAPETPEEEETAE